MKLEIREIMEIRGRFQDVKLMTPSHPPAVLLFSPLLLKEIKVIIEKEPDR